MRWFRYIAFMAVLVSCTIGTEVRYSDMPLEFFLDTWWSIESNEYFDDGTCFLLKSKDMSVRVHDPVGDYEYTSNFEWEIVDDHIEVYGSGISLEVWPYGTCDEYSVRISSDFSTEESSLYECDF